VIANGGGCARARARLARRMLDHVGANDVPVGVGSDGTEVAAQPHEYKLQGCLEVPDNTLRDGGELLLDALSRAPDQTVSVVLISSLRDFADVCARAPALVRRKVCVVAVQGGLVPNTTAPAGWVPDTSVNNEFDREAAAAVYDFCFEHGLPMTVTSRHAVPVIPMQLARSFAERTDCPVMRYLADAQFLGLCCLWMRLCDDKLPARCTKQVGRGDARGAAAARRRAARGRARFAELSERG
jgi:inosine-uridine nucleoside N-ribohydrolase